MNWEPEWIETAHDIAKRMYDEVYAKKGSIPGDETTTVVVNPKVHFRLPSSLHRSTFHRNPTTYLMIFLP
jgi:hypothetical protein